MAYALMLKNTGVLYHQLYLTATVMGLAPCGLGMGDSDLFAEAAGLDYYQETAVGEFMLGGGLTCEPAPIQAVPTITPRKNT
jgi:SagB-type dehydrogenase family enzyme